MLRDFSTPEECAIASGFWREEGIQTNKAKEIVKKFEKVRPHDYFKVEPQSYNLSIQYDNEKKGDDAKKKMKEKKR
jgi:hypothetical protein